MPVTKNMAHNIPFALVNASDGSPEIGATVTAYRSLDGDGQQSVSGIISELGNGQYLFEGEGEDFNANFTAGFLFISTGAVPVHILLQMQYFRPDTAYAIPFLLVSTNTGLGLTGATPVGKRCLDGGVQENVSGSFAELGNGQYLFQADVADFDANDIVGFLITAAGALPIHLIIDLLESYDVVGESPASVVASYLTGVALMSVPSAESDWPLYISYLRDDQGVKDNAGAIYNTTPTKDGRRMRVGTVLQHFGIQIIIRALSEETGWAKCNVLANQLDTVTNVDVLHTDGFTYRLHNISRMGGINPLGEEQTTKRRKLFSMNFLISMTKL